MHKIALEHPSLTSFTLYADGAEISEGRCCGSIEIDLPRGEIEVWLNPMDKNWGIVPRIRIDGFLVNTYLAGIDVFDHMFKFIFADDFFWRYANMNVASILSSVPAQYRDDEGYISKYFGLSGANTDLVRDIRLILDEKSDFHNNT